MKRENSVLLTLFIYTLLILLPLRAGASKQDDDVVDADFTEVKK